MWQVFFYGSTEEKYVYLKGHNWMASKDIFPLCSITDKTIKILCYAFTNNNIKIIFEMLESYLDLLLNNFSFSGSSTGKESAWNEGDPDLIPGLGRSNGGMIGYPLQYFWASLGVQMVNNLPAMQETWVWSLGREDPLEEWMATLSRTLFN